MSESLHAALFHRHARGLVLTEQGELLYRTAQDVFMKLASAEILLSDSRGKPSGDLRITTTVALGTIWLTPRLGEFMSLYPDIRVQLILNDEELDLGMREADIAIRLQPPSQNDLIRRKLFTVHNHVYASLDYVKKHGAPRTLADLDRHRFLDLWRNRAATFAPAQLAGNGWSRNRHVAAPGNIADQQCPRPDGGRAARARHCDLARLRRQGRSSSSSPCSTGRRASRPSTPISSIPRR